MKVSLTALGGYYCDIWHMISQVTSKFESIMLLQGPSCNCNPTVTLKYLH